MLSWPDDRAEIAARIRSQRARLKLILKTKNDPLLLEEWIRHHLCIVGEENLVIADNESTDEDVLRTYRELSHRICIFRFRGLHNHLHEAARFPDIYHALSESCMFMQFLDTDERLVVVRDGKWSGGEAVLNFVAAQNPNELVTACWPTNVPGSKTSFLFAPRSYALHMLQWGKSVIPPQRDWPPGHLLHNCQLDLTKIKPGMEPGLFVLHLQTITHEQRLRANKQKLMARGAIRGDETYDEIASAQPLPGSLPGSQFYLTEFRNLYLVASGAAPAPAWPRKFTFELGEKGEIVFGSEEVRNIYNEYFETFPEFFAEAMRRNADLTPK